MTPIGRAAVAGEIALAVAVAVEVDPTKVLAWVAAAFFAALAWFVQREWNRHELRHDATDAKQAAHAEDLRQIKEQLRAMAREESP